MAQCIKYSYWFHQNCENIADAVFRKRAPFTCSSCKEYRNIIVTQEYCDVIVQATDIVQSRDCATIVRNLEIGTQFPDSENVQRNLEMAQIPRLQGT